MLAHDVEASREVRRFAPIPEARALKHTELFPTTREALVELLSHLRSAVETSANQRKHEMLSTSFLVSGDRGFGKTTVLLTAAAEIENAEKGIIADGMADEPDPLRPILQDLKRRIVWLDTLDLEPVPKGANLLAALLVRIRDALEHATDSDDPEAAARHGGGCETSESALGGHIEKTWEQLDRLVQDATFMWEETSHVNDPRRERAQQQIKAAEIFASFQQRFADAVGQVACTLNRITSKHEPVLVLPVDNVDRSTEHIYSIVKLCRLASSARLWFLLAAGRPDFQFFLERSFQQEMSSGRPSAEDRDDDLSIARRQASTTMRRALPRAHQIQIEPIDLATAWTADCDGDACLATLFRTVPLLPGSSEESPLTLFDLFDVNGQVTDDVRVHHPGTRGPGSQQEPKDALLTHAARMALLNLSPRALRDLKRSISTACLGSGAACEGAVQVLANQLRSAIDESILPFWAGTLLHGQILRKDMHGSLVLDLRGGPIRQLKQTHLSQVVPFDHDWVAPVSRSPAVVFSDVHLRKFDDIVLELHNPDRPGQSVPLPADVAGWFMLLHDLLKMLPTPRVISGGVTSHDPVLSPELIVTRHELSLDLEQVWLEFGWLLPEWDTFLDFSIFTIQWRAFLHFLEEKLREDPETFQELLRLVRAAWVENVCSVCSEHGHWSWEELKKNGRSAVGSYEVIVGGRVSSLTPFCSSASQGQGVRGKQPFEERRFAQTGLWLERSLPVLLGSEYSVGLQQEVIEALKLRAPGVRLRRWQLVREAAMRSTAYKALQSTRSTARGELVDGAPGKDGERWLRSICEVWFGPSERRNHRGRGNGAGERGERRTGGERRVQPEMMGAPPPGTH